MSFFFLFFSSTLTHLIFFMYLVVVVVVVHHVSVKAFSSRNDAAATAQSTHAPQKGVSSPPGLDPPTVEPAGFDNLSRVCSRERSERFSERDVGHACVADHRCSLVGSSSQAAGSTPPQGAQSLGGTSSSPPLGERGSRRLGGRGRCALPCPLELACRMMEVSK